MKVFVTGVAGQLGHDVVNELTKRGHQAVGSDIAPTLESCASYVPLDITDAAAVEQTIMQVQPDAIVHCAAWTAVDAAEDEENQAKVRAINVDGTKHIADAAKKADAKMVYISTDYVFDGQGETPWEPDCKAYAPLNVYGQTKLGGELAVAQTLGKYFIVRIATYTYDLARLLVDMMETEKYGYYHATNEGGYISWYDFTKEIYRQAGLTTEVQPVTTAEYGLSKAARPFNSRLEKKKLKENGFTPLPTWQDALGRYLQELKRQGEL